jgi:biotin carboxyl carrier protein
MYKVKVNNKNLFEIDADITHLQPDNHAIVINQMPNQSFDVSIDNQLLNADIIDWDPENNIAKIKINQNLYEVVVQEPANLLLEKLGMTIAKPKKNNNLISPMPGLILKILVQENQQIKKGDSLLILEAMKMENVFKANFDATIKSINIEEKQAVEKGQELITFA